MSSKGTSADWINSIVAGSQVFPSEGFFCENSPAEREKFYAAWCSDQARAARDAQDWHGAAIVADELRHVLGALDRAKKAGWPENPFHPLPPTSGGTLSQQLSLNNLAIIGNAVARAFADGDPTLLRELAAIAEGSERQPRSGWKERILATFCNLCLATPQRLPSKKELRAAVGGLEAGKFREYSKELGLSGLPSAKGVRGKQVRPRKKPRKKGEG